MSLVWCLHVVGAYSGDGPTDTMSARFDSFPFARAVRVRLGHARARARACVSFHTVNKKAQNRLREEARNRLREETNVMEEGRAPLNQEVMEQKQRLINEVLRGEQRGEQRGPLRTSMQPAPARGLWLAG